MTLMEFLWEMIVGVEKLEMEMDKLPYIMPTDVLVEHFNKLFKRYRLKDDLFHPADDIPFTADELEVLTTYYRDDPHDATYFLFKIIEIIATNQIEKFEVGDKVKVNYFFDTCAYNGKIGTIRWLHDYHCYLHGDLSEMVKKTQGVIRYEDGHEEAVNDFYRKGERSIVLVSKGERNQNHDTSRF